jgi:PKD repeat protein
MKKFLSVIGILVIAGLLWSVIPTVFAQGEGVPTGGLLTPVEVQGVAGQQYDSGIKAGGGDLKTLVIQVTNYVLGFVGMIALVAFIYAGLLYVANFGNDDMTTKAKTILIYTSVGILVIILSYAFVSALVGAASKSAGDTCSVTADDCGARFACVQTLDTEDLDDVGVCRLKAHEAEFTACTVSAQNCAPGLSCRPVSETPGEDAGICVSDIIANGEFSPCQSNAVPSQCPLRLLCYSPTGNDAGQCRKPLDIGVGNVCTDDAACAQGLICYDGDNNGEGTCMLPFGSGIPCNLDGNCPAGELCVRNQCLVLGSADPSATGSGAGNSFAQAGDFVQSVITAFKRLGDVCPSTTIGLAVDDSGCASTQILADTDADGEVNVIDRDDDNDGTPDELDSDVDGDSVANQQDVCPDTLSFRAFELLGLESDKPVSERTSRTEYEAAISNTSFPGCAGYQISPDIDGDNVGDFADCDADGDSLLDTEECIEIYSNFLGGSVSATTDQPGNGALMPDRGITVPVRIGELDNDDDDDGVNDFGLGETAASRREALISLSQTFEQLRRSILVTCARLPETTEVLSYCAFEDVDGDGQKDPVGALVQMLDRLDGSSIDLPEWEEFRRLYQRFQQMLRDFPKVAASFSADVTSAELPGGGVPLPINFDASRTIDPYQDICPTDNNDYFWFINETIDWSLGLEGILSAGKHVGSGVFFNRTFTQPGVYNVQLLVRSACTLGEVVPQTDTGLVDSAMAGLSSLRVRVVEPRAELIVFIDDAQQDPGFDPVEVLANDFVEVNFDLRSSRTNRGPFEKLSYSCGGGQSRVIEAPEPQWQFSCNWEAPTGRNSVQLFAQDREGRIERNIELVFRNVVAAIDVSPISREGTVETEFVFDASRSKARGGSITNWEWEITRETLDIAGALVEDIDSFSGGPTFTRRFDREGAGNYTVTLTVSVGSGQPAVASVNVRVVPRDPVPIFTAVFPDQLHPERVRLDATASFHPDDVSNTIPLTFEWSVDGVDLHAKTGDNDVGNFFVPIDEVAGDNALVTYDFDKKGTHTVELTVSDGSSSASLVREITVESILGVDFVPDTFALHAGDTVRFSPRSPRAVGFFWNFGDDFTLVADKNPVSHKYDEQGVYSVSLEVEDSTGDTNKVTKKIRVGLANSPVGVIEALVRGRERIPQSAICNGGIEITRKDTIILDASDSINVKGDSNGLEFVWDLGNDTRARGATTTVRFDELSGTGCESIKLVVTDDTTGEDDRARIGVKVINIEPEMSGLRVFAPVKNVTPVTVPIQVIGDRDPDGRIVEYKWWYYADGKKSEKREVHTTQSNSTRFVLGPDGVEGQKVRYFFVVEMTDIDGATVNSEELIGSSEGVTIVNGPNIVPEAEYTVSKTSLRVGERLAFTSTTIDPLGEYIPSGAYQWDFEGDGKFEKGVNGAAVTTIYERPGKYQPVLRVVKNGLSTRYSMDITVLPNTVAPEAAFLFVKSGSEVTFVNNSVVDSTLRDKEIRYHWDFDTSIDTDGNGEADDDVDSALANPVHEFSGSKDVEVRLLVTDVMGNSDDVRRLVEFVVKPDRGPLGAASKIRLKAVLETNPERNQIDGKVYLRPPLADVIFVPKRSTGKIQEYRIDTNLFVDSDGDGIKDNDIDNKTHASWKDGSPFKHRYKIEDGKIRAGLLVVNTEGVIKGTALDIAFSGDDMTTVLQERLADPDQALTVLDDIPVVSFDVSDSFVQPGDVVRFDATRTRFPDEKVAEYLWDFDGDGLIDELSFEPVFSYAYPKEGVYEAILEASSEDGLTGDYSQTVIVRGGLQLPTALFTYNKDGRTVRFANSSNVDASFGEDEVSYEWSFVKLDLGSLPEWASWGVLDDYIVQADSLGLDPLRVKGTIRWAADSEVVGVLPRRIALGSGDMVALFDEGELIFTQGESPSPFGGSLSLIDGLSFTPDVPGEVFAAADTGMADLVTFDKGVSLVVEGALQGGNLFILLDEAVVAGPYIGEIKGGRTYFSRFEFGGQLVVTGALSGADAGGTVLGVSSAKDPVKIFEEEGTYRVTLEVMDGVGEVSEAQEVITLLSEDFVLPEVEPEEEVGERLDSGAGSLEEEEGVESQEPRAERDEPVVPERSGDDGGFSVWSIVMGVVVLLGGAVIVLLVVQFVRRKMRGGGGQNPSIAGSAISSEAYKNKDTPVVEAEVVKSPEPGAESREKKPESVAVEEEKKEEKPADTPQPPKGGAKKSASPSKKKDDDGPAVPSASSGPSAKGGSGPIPDWLKN